MKTISGQLLQQSTADYKLAGKAFSPIWRGDTGLHGQLHGTLAGAWFQFKVQRSLLFQELLMPQAIKEGRMKNLLLSFILLFLAGCGAFYENMENDCSTKVISGTRENGVIQKVHKDGWVYNEGKVDENGREGWWTYYRKDGTIYTKKLFKNGEMEGRFEQYYENGQLAVKGICAPPDFEPKDVEFFSPEGKPISMKEFHQRKYGDLQGEWIHDLYEAQRMRLF